MAAEDALAPGELRQGTGGVDLGGEDFFEPPLIDETQEQDFKKKTWLMPKQRQLIKH